MEVFEAISVLSEAKPHITFLTDSGGCKDFAEFATAMCVTFCRPMCNLVSANIIWYSNTNSLGSWWWW